MIKEINYIYPKNGFASSETTIVGYGKDNMAIWNEYFLFNLDVAAQTTGIAASQIRLAADMADAMLKEYMERAEVEEDE